MSTEKSYRVLFLLGIPIIVAALSFSIWSNEEVAANSTIDPNLKITPLDSYTAGETIVFTTNEISPSIENTDAILYLSSSYGSITITPEVTNNQLIFRVPYQISEKSGELFWQLFHTNNELGHGSFHINPNPEMASIVESYLGPETIVAGESDYSMIVVTATDKYDNLVPNGTSILLKSFVDNTIKSYHKTTQDRFTWERLYSSKKSGRILVSGTSDFAATHEKTLNVIPNNATSFSISSKLVHPYADGNQIALFSTTVIKDEFDNIISDGTLVSFLVTTSEGEKLEASGTTINGIASGQFLHPNKPTTWKIEAYVMGLAKSPAVEISFASVLEHLNVSFTSNNRSIAVGPMTSYMEQIIPDGVEVILSIKSYNQIYTLTSKNGLALFQLNPTLCPNGSVTIQIESMGVSETFEKILR